MANRKLYTEEDKPRVAVKSWIKRIAVPFNEVTEAKKEKGGKVAGLGLFI